jgi:hypothetical protein
MEGMIPRKGDFLLIEDDTYEVLFVTFDVENKAIGVMTQRLKRK